MPTKHLTYGGSTIARTLACPVWTKLAELLPRGDSSSSFADEGTLLHNCMEEYFDSNPATWSKEGSLMMMLEEGRKYKEQLLTQELVDNKLVLAAQETLGLLDSLDVTEYQCEPFVEIIPGIAGGYIDMLGFSEDGKTALILDYKFGHTTVKAEDNKQLLFYALAAAVDPATQHLFEHVETLALAIVQPNQDGEVLDVWTTPVGTLDAFEDAVFEAIDSTDTETHPGKHCKYCPVEATCPSKTGQILNSMKLDPTQTTDLIKILAAAPEIESTIKAARKLAFEQLEAGNPIEGFKLVNKRASRVWTNAIAVEDKVRKAKKIKLEQGMDYKLKSPAQLEKVCKELKIDFKPYSYYIASVSSGLTLAKESDKRPSAVPLAAMAKLRDMASS